jgi:hypothetical protein
MTVVNKDGIDLLHGVLLPQVLALTFDDGPHPASLPAVLDVLKAQAVPATFFVNTYTASDWLGPFSSPPNQVTQPLAVTPSTLASVGAQAASALCTWIVASTLPQLVVTQATTSAAATAHMPCSCLRLLLQQDGANQATNVLICVLHVVGTACGWYCRLP